MSEDLLQIVEHRGESYRTVIRFDTWRVAFLNYHSRFQHENITELESHLLTDETFTLLKGKAILFVSDGDEHSPGKISAFRMEPEKIYNVR